MLLKSRHHLSHGKPRSRFWFIQFPFSYFCHPRGMIISFLLNGPSCSIREVIRFWNRCESSTRGHNPSSPWASTLSERWLEFLQLTKKLGGIWCFCWDFPWASLPISLCFCKSLSIERIRWNFSKPWKKRSKTRRPALFVGAYIMLLSHGSRLPAFTSTQHYPLEKSLQK